MAAPKGNQFWKARSSHGRKPIFASPDDLWEAACEYFEWVHDNPLMEPMVYQGKLSDDYKPKMRAMTESALCLFLDISDVCWLKYKGRDDFVSVTKKICQIIYNQKFNGAAADMLNPNIIARDLGLQDKKETKIKGEMKHSVIEFVPVDSSHESNQD
jgi:hypothetical protein